MNDEVSKLRLKIKALQDISGNTGICAMGGKERPKDVEKSDAYKFGWNDAAIEFARKTDAIMKTDWQIIADDLLLLVTSGDIWIWGEKIMLNMNDTFAWGCADCEEIPKDKVKEVAQLYRRYGNMGLTYWVSKKRKWLLPSESEKEFKHIRKEILRIRKLERKQK